MQKRKLGNTGIEVGEIGLGCEGFLGKDEEFTSRMLGIALDSGVNMMDMYSPDPDVHRRVGKAIRSVRKDFVLQAHLCTEWKDGQYRAVRDIDTVTRSFEKMLSNFGTDYIDVGMIHYVDSSALWKRISEGDVMRYAVRLKESGVIRSIGVSSHNPEAALAAVKSGLVDVLMFSVNPCYDLLPGDEDVEKLFDETSYAGQLSDMDPARKELYETCQRLGVGITVMKAFGGGDLLTDNSPAGKALTVAQCLHYALTRPAVACVMAGAHSENELRAALNYEQASDAERDYAAALASFPRMSWKGHCMYCGHCAPCPKGISVADVTKFLSLATTRDSVPETVREHYLSLDAKAEDCIECGACERRCPFDVKVIGNMRAAKRVFGA